VGDSNWGLSLAAFFCSPSAVAPAGVLVSRVAFTAGAKFIKLIEDAILIICRRRG
jgi:hypothetical protein